MTVFSARALLSVTAICGALALSGCHSKLAQKMKSAAGKGEAVSGAVPGAGAKNTAAKIAGLKNPGASVKIDGDRYAVSKKRYISLTGEPCILAALGYYENVQEEPLPADGGLAEAAAALNAEYFVPEEHTLSCRRAGEWRLYPYYAGKDDTAPEMLTQAGGEEDKEEADYEDLM